MHICEYCGESVLDAFLSVSDMPYLFQRPCELTCIVSIFFPSGGKSKDIRDAKSRVVGCQETQVALNVRPSSPSPNFTACECEDTFGILKS